MPKITRPVSECLAAGEGQAWRALRPVNTEGRGARGSLTLRLGPLPLPLGVGTGLQVSGWCEQLWWCPL